MEKGFIERKNLSKFCEMPLLGLLFLFLDMQGQYSNSDSH